MQRKKHRKWKNVCEERMSTQPNLAPVPVKDIGSPITTRHQSRDPHMTCPADILCAGIVVADHICTPIDHLPAAGELVLAERILLTIGGCAANVAVDLAR